MLWLFLDNRVLTYAFNGMYVADPMTSVLKLFAVLAVGFMLVYAQGYARDRGMWKGELFTLTLFALLGIMVMISANNLLVVYLGLELQALSLYALVALRRDDARSSEAAMKYFVLGALASGFLLYGMSMLYGGSGTLDINELARRVATGQVASRLSLVLGVVFVDRRPRVQARRGAVPHVGARRLPRRADAGHAADRLARRSSRSSPIAFRMLVEGLLPLAADWQQMLIVLAVASLVLGNLTAIAQTNLKRMLAYSTIAQMGFMLLAMLSGVVERRPGRHGDRLQRRDVLRDHLRADDARHLRRHPAAGARGLRGGGDRRPQGPEPAQPVVCVRDAAADVLAGGHSSDRRLLRQARRCCRRCSSTA